MESRTIDLGGPVHYVDFGGSGRPMVLVHGLGGSHANWLSVGARLAERSRVLALDLPGFGRTPPAGRSVDMEAHQSLLDRFIERVAGGPAVVVGNSMGGLVAMLQAARVPARVSGLVLVAPAAPVPWRGPFDRRVTALFGLYMLPGLGPAVLRRRLAAVGTDASVRAMLKLCAANWRAIEADVLEAHLALAREREAWTWTHDAMTAAARAVVLTVARRARYAEMVRAIAAPTLWIHGDRDPVVALPWARAVHASRPDWAVEVLDGVGHVPQLEAPSRFVDAVHRWLAPD